MRKTWAIIWRVIWVLMVLSTVPSGFKDMFSDGDIISGILGFCLSCVILNIPIYIWAWTQKDKADQAWDSFISWFNWEFHPVRTLIVELVLAPVATVYCAVMLAIQAIGFITGRYDI